MYRVTLTRRAEKQLDAAPEPIRARAVLALEALQADPRRPHPGFDCSKLAGSEALWRVRIGSWRLLYAIDDDVRVVQVTKVGPRSSVYGR